jgi:hypothetical protein
MLHQRLGYIPSHPLLIGEAVPDGVDHSCDAAESMQTSAGQVGHMGQAPEGNQVVRTDAMHGNAADDDHVAAVIGKPVTERAGRVQIITTEQAFLPEFADALSRSTHVRNVWINAAGAEQIADGAFESRRIEIISAGNAYGRCGKRRMVVVIAVGHRVLPVRCFRR